VKEKEKNQQTHKEKKKIIKKTVSCVKVSRLRRRLSNINLVAAVVSQLMIPRVFELFFKICLFVCWLSCAFLFLKLL
jgi:hypothetical protein